MCSNPLQLWCYFCWVRAYSRGLLSPGVTMPVGTKSFVAVWWGKMSRVILDSWFFGRDSIYRAQAGHARHFVKRSRFSASGSHQGRRGPGITNSFTDLLVRFCAKHPNVSCAVLLFLSLYSQPMPLRQRGQQGTEGCWRSAQPKTLGALLSFWNPRGGQVSRSGNVMRRGRGGGLTNT